MGKTSELFVVKTLTDALALLRPYFLPLYTRQEDVEILEAWGRLLAADVRAPEPLPHYCKSTVDGLAVQAAATFGASEAMPALIQVQGEIRMGQAPVADLHSGAGMLIPTGGMLPSGADAVVMVEYLDDFGDGLYGVTKAVAPGENVIAAGEDVQSGQVVLNRYTRVRAQEMGLCAALGLVKVPVVLRPKVGVLSTGDEIVPPTQAPQPAQTRDINGYTLYGQVQACGGSPRYYGIVPDNQTALRRKLEEMLAENDVILLSGGSSVGARDMSAELIGSLGEPGLLFHGLAVRPGKPTIAGVAGDKVIFGLPGHPASAMIVFDNLVRPCLDGSLWQEQELPRPEGVLTQNVYSGTGREEFVRVRMVSQAGEWQVEPLRGKSGLISTMTAADGTVHIPLNTEGIKAGQRVRVRLWER